MIKKKDGVSHTLSTSLMFKSMDLKQTSIWPWIIPMLLSRSHFPHLWKGRKGNGWVCQTLSSPSWDWGVPVIHESFASVFSPTPYNIVSFFLLPLVCSFPFRSSPLVCQCLFCMVDTQHRFPLGEQTWNSFRRQLWKRVILIFTHSIYIMWVINVGFIVG